MKMTLNAPRLLLALVAWFAVAAQAFNGPPDPFWWLNTFLGNQTIGRFEERGFGFFSGIGLCRDDTPSGGCNIDFATLPDEVKALGVVINAGIFNGTFTLGSLFTSGLIRIYHLELNDIEINNVLIGGTSNSTFQNMSVVVDSFKGNIRMKLKFADIKIPGFPSLNLDIVAKTNKSQQLVGTDVDMQIFFKAPAGKTLATSIPNEVTLGPCNIDLDLALNLDIANTIFPFQNRITDVTNLIVGIAQPLLGNFVCAAIRQLFTEPAGGTVGLVKKYVDLAFEEIGNVSLRADPVLATEEAAMVASLTPEQRAKAITFAENPAIEGASIVINNWLGQGNPNNPLVNEVVNLLTSPDNGTATFTNLTRFGLTIPIHTPIAKVTVLVHNATIIGLNTFGAPGGFQLIKNNYDNSEPRLNYTLDNRFSLRSLNVSLVADIKLERNLSTEGGWIYNRPPLGLSETSFRVHYNLGIKDLDVIAALALALDPTQLRKIQIGQLLGKANPNATTAVAQAIEGGKCAAPAIYGFRIPSLQLNMSDIIDPVFEMDPVDTGIVTLVNDVTSIVLHILEAPITKDLPKISQHWVRPLVNEFIADAFVSGGVETLDCLEYTDQGKSTPNLLNSALFNQAKQLIRDAIGGDPVKSNTVSINELLHQVVLFACEAYGSPATCSTPASGKWRFSPALSFTPGKSFPVNASYPSSVSVTGLDINGLNSVTKLLLDNVPGYPQGISFLLELGALDNPLEIIVKNRWTVNYDAPFTKLDVDELFTLTIALTGLRINATVKPDFDLNQLYLLTVEDLFHSACILAPLASLDLNVDLSLFNISVLTATTPGPQSSIGNDLRDALDTLSSEQYLSLKTMVDFVLKSVGTFIVEGSSLVNNSVVNATNCREQFNLFDTFVTRIIRSALSANLTDVFAKATGPQPPVPAAAVLDSQVQLLLGSDPFDMADSFFVPLVNKAVQGVSQPSFREVLQTLGNGTGDVLSDSFKTNLGDGSVDLDIDFMNYTMFKDGFDLSFFIENATFFLYQVKVTNLTNLDMDSIEVLNPLSKFVTRTHISIPGRSTVFLGLGISLPQALKGLAGPNVLTNINFTMDLVDLDVAVQALTALDSRRLNGLSLGHFISVDANQTFSLNLKAVNCLLRLFLPGGLSLPELKISLSSIGSPSIVASSHDFISDGFIRTIETMVRILADFYVKDLADLTQGGLRQLINEFLLAPNLENPGTCDDPAPPPLPAASRILNFQKSTTIGFLNEFTRDLLAGNDGKYSLFNTVLSAAMDTAVLFAAPDHEIGFESLKVVYKKQVLGRIGAFIRDVNIKGLGSFTNLNLLEAVNNVTLANNLSFAGPFDVTFGTKWNVTDVWAVDDGTGIVDELQFLVSMRNVTLGLTLLMEIDIPDLLVIQAGSFNNFSQIACVLSAFRKFAIKKFTFDVDSVAVDFRCAGICESPLFEGLQTGLPVANPSTTSNLADYIPQVIELVVTYLNSESFTNSAQDAVDTAADSCVQALNLSTVIAVLNAELNHGINVAVIFGLALIGIGAALLLLAPLSIPRHYQLKDKMLAANLLQANSQPGANAQSVAKFMAKAERDQLALAWHPSVSGCCKCFVPVMAIGNVLLLALSFIVYLSFSVDARLFVFGSDTKIYSLVPWTISSTINDMWNSGAWPLSILIVFASCAWPVVKNIALFGIWFAPKTFLGHENRMRYLVLLDILGKWSFLDVYIIVLLVGALKFTLVLGQAPLLEVLNIPNDVVVLEVIVTPGIGIILLCVAAFMSLIVNHVIIRQLEHAEWADRRLFKQIDGEPDDYLTPKASIRLAISEYVFSTTAPNGQRDRYGPRAKNSVIILIVSSIVFVIAGDFVPYFTLTYDGLVGLALAFFIQGGRERTFSLMSIGALLPTASTGTPYYNALFLFFTVLYFATVIIAPILQLALHLFLWLRPLSIKDAHTVLFFAKVAAYWAAIEVFCLAIIALTIEVKPVTLFLFDFITGGTCSALVAPLSEIDELGEKDGNCLTPGAHVEWGFFISFASNLYQIAVGAIMIRASGVAIRDREDVLERRPHQEWSTLEYLILDKLLVHGADHHKPQPKLNDGMFSAFVREFFASPCRAITNVFSKLCSKLNICAGCCTGVQDVSLTAPVSKTGKVANSKWNTAPSSPAPSNRWNSPSQAYGNAPSPSWNMGQPSQGQMTASQQMESPNPIFAREQQSKRYSVDV